MSVRTIIEQCGGAKAIAERSASTDHPIGSAKTVYSWVENGIPEWHWPLVREMSGATLEDLHTANQQVRALRKRPTPLVAAVA